MPTSRNRSKDATFKPGDSVRWNSPQGETHGKVVERLTAESQIGSHKVKAEPDHPQYLVKSDKTGKEAAHKPEALEKS
jgi:hypothetical protein